MTAQELWQTTLERLREHLPPAAANNWFAETAALSLVDDVPVVALKSMTPLFKLEHRYQDVLNAHLAAIMGRPIQVEYVYHPSLARLFDTGKLSPDVLSSSPTVVDEEHRQRITRTPRWTSDFLER